MWPAVIASVALKHIPRTSYHPTQLPGRTVKYIYIYLSIWQASLSQLLLKEHKKTTNLEYLEKSLGSNPMKINPCFYECYSYIQRPLDFTKIYQSLETENMLISSSCNHPAHKHTSQTEGNSYATGSGGRENTAQGKLDMYIKYFHALFTISPYRTLTILLYKTWVHRFWWNKKKTNFWTLILTFNWTSSSFKCVYLSFCYFIGFWFCFVLFLISKLLIGQV